MTAPSNPTPATLDAAVTAAARHAYDEVRDGIIRDARWKPPAPWDELSDLDKHYWLVTIRPHIETALPILAAGHADQLAQAHAAGTAEGAAAERERIALAIERARVQFVWPKSYGKAAAGELVAGLVRHLARIARAGTSGDAS